MKRVFLIVLDSVGVGALPDAAEYGDAGVNTLGSISKSEKFSAKNMKKLGLGLIDGIEFIGRTKNPGAAYGRMAELSKGKDTTIGHWEMAGIISERPLPTYPDGFPEDVIRKFSEETGRGVLCNKPYSGTEVIKEYGEEHMQTGDLIVYTSADSVFQIAAHEDIVPVEQLYEYCRKARKILTGKHSVGRVIARPFVGNPGEFVRTSNRHDFSLEPYGVTMLDVLKDAGKDVISIGKINDVFASRGVTESNPTKNNAEGMKKTAEMLERDFNGLCFINLVDFDMLYGHRQDIDGYAEAFAQFDKWLPAMLNQLREDDVVIVTADHGCDPADDSTDHTREYVPLLVYGKRIKPVSLGTRACFADVAASVCEWLNVDYSGHGSSFAWCVDEKLKYQRLLEQAEKARELAYAPYSNFSVGAALLAKSGKVYIGCNVENSSYGATVCAERIAFFKAVGDGETEFEAIAVAGGKRGRKGTACPPCGMCRQVMAEFCGSDFLIILAGQDGYEKHSLKELLPMSFDKSAVTGK